MKPFISFILPLLLLYGCYDHVETTKPRLDTLTESVYASATILPKNMYLAYASNPGTIETIWVEEGDRVEKDQILAQLKIDQSAIHVDNAFLQLDLAKENYQGQANELQSIAHEIVLLENQLRIDSLNYYRQQKLWDHGVGSKSDLETKKLKYETSKNSVDQLKKKHQQIDFELKNKYSQSQNALKLAQTQYNDYFIKAAIEGKVYHIHKESGEYINPQEAFAQIGDVDSFMIEMRIDEVDITKISLKQKIILIIDAYRDSVFEAEVTKIYPFKDARTQTYRVDGAFTQPPQTLYAGFSGEANIIVAEKEQVITIPIEYLIENHRVKTPDGEITVNVGKKNLERVEIISGIDTNTVLIKP